MVQIGNDWDEILAGEFDKEYYLTLRKFLAYEYRHTTIYPSMYDIFNALKYTPFHEVRVVILGQDPYHNPGQAHGLSFSVQDGVPAPPSLQNIYKEIGDEYHTVVQKNGNLTGWAKQGVLLLNTVLTVRANQANSHKGMGWELWGANAKAKRALITNPKHLVLTAAHPSPLSAFNGFFGCGHFIKTNQFLKENGLPEIDWLR